MATIKNIIKNWEKTAKENSGTPSTKVSPKKKKKKVGSEKEFDCEGFINTIAAHILGEDDLAVPYGPYKGAAVRASGAHMYCPRLHVLSTLYGDGSELGIAHIPIELAWTFEVGTAVHAHLQDQILAKTKAILGCWENTITGEVKGEVDIPDTWLSSPGPEWKFLEPAAYNDKYDIGGHTDGGIDMPNGRRAILEIKTISKGQFDKLNKPKPEHVVQASIYMWLFGLQDALFFYACKGWCKSPYRRAKRMYGTNGYQLGPLKTFHIPYDGTVILRLQKAIEKAQKSLKSVEEGVEAYPPRLKKCTSESCSRAKECGMSAMCFELDE